MTYLVMETHPAYAVVLDEEGRFLKAANLGYQMGDRVEEIVELRYEEKKVFPLGRALSGLAVLAACLCLAFFGYYQPNYTAYGSLRIQINPDVELTVSRTDRVLEVEGLNGDGQDLVAGYDCRGKDRETVTGELLDRAVDMGYLSDGDTVSVTVSSADPDWQSREEEAVQAQLEERYGAAIVIQVGPAEGEDPGGETQVVIPVGPAPSPSPAPSGGNYGESDYGSGGESAPVPGPAYTDGDTDYDDRDQEPEDDQDDDPEDDLNDDLNDDQDDDPEDDLNDDQDDDPEDDLNDDQDDDPDGDQDDGPDGDLDDDLDDDLDGEN